MSPNEACTEYADFDLVQNEAERRLGVIFREGEGKYRRNNWRSGSTDREYQLERANHALKHLRIYIHQLEFGEHLGEADEDDLAKVMWFCATQMELERLASRTDTKSVEVR